MSLPVQNFNIVLKIKNKSGVNASVNELEIVSQNVQYLTITENILSILPRFEMVLNDVGGLTESFSILDDDVLSVELSPTADAENFLDMEFNISDVAIDSDNGENHYNVIKMVGYMRCTDMFVPYRNRSFSKDSADILRDIAKESGITFENPHNVLPSDKMIWYQDENNYDFVKHVLNRGYITNDALFFYASSQNKFVYTSLVSEMEKEENFKTEMNAERVENFLLQDRETDIMFFNAYDIQSLHGVYNKMSNYGASFGFYNLKAEFEGGILDSVKKFTDLYNKNKRYDGQPSIFVGIGLFGNPNIFDEYPVGIIQNYFMKYNFFENSVVLNINSMTNVKLFDKVNVSIPSAFGGELNEIHSGHYLVAGITHNVTSDGVYQKKVMLSRNGINKSDALKDIDVN